MSEIDHKVEAGTIDDDPFADNTCWEGTLGNGESLHVYYFHDSLTSVPWSTIVEEELYEGPLVTTLTDLKNSGWTVILD